MFFNPASSKNGLFHHGILAYRLKYVDDAIAIRN
ncbi:hypothetical protein FB480_10189 [Agrobacterium vitis]|nr:hypothetical protein FB480_10189 [Agrobacterium vitis]